MVSGRQSLVLPLLWEAHRFATGCKEEAGRAEHLGVIASHGLGEGPSETYPAIPLFHSPNYSRDYSAPKSLQIAAFRPTEGSRGTIPPAAMPACSQAMVLNICAIPTAGAGSAPRVSARKGRTS